jgi:predicted MFS family arabinose efflux permease
VSSMVSGLLIGGLRRSFPLYKQLLAGSTVLAVLLLPLLASQGLVMTAVILFLAGAAVSPTLIAGFTFVQRLVPAARLTEALNWATTALGVGFALGSPSSGWLVDEVSLGAGYWVGIASAGLAVVAAISGRTSLDVAGSD